MRSADLGLYLWLVVVTGVRRVSKDTKTHQDRWLAIDTITCALIASHLAEVKASRRSVSAREMTRTCLQPPSAARPRNPGWVTHKVADAADAAGVQLDIEGGRHYTASQLLVGGFDLRNTATRFGSQWRRRDHAATLQPT